MKFSATSFAINWPTPWFSKFATLISVPVQRCECICGNEREVFVLTSVVNWIVRHVFHNFIFENVIIQYNLLAQLLTLSLNQIWCSIFQLHLASLHICIDTCRQI